MRLIPLFLIAAAAGMTACGSHRDASSQNSAFEAYDAFNTVFLDSAKNIYKNTTADSAAVDRWNGAAAIWCQPMYADMAMNAMLLAEKTGDLARKKQYRNLANDIIDGNIAHYVKFDFDNNDTNLGWFIYDDIQWWTITMARAAAILGRDDCRELAEKSFARVWYGSPRVGDTGSYADPAKGLGGGMFWQWQPLEHPEANAAGDGKMSCINFPTVVAAMLLHEIVPAEREADAHPETWSNEYGSFSRPHYETKERYLEMAKEIYGWAVDKLGDMSTGMIVDNRHGDSRGGAPLLYNQGTFIGASALLYKATGDSVYLDNAIAGADFSVNELSKGGSLPWAHNPENPYDQGSLEQGIYPAIWAQYMDLLVNGCGQEKYREFIEKNIAAGLSHRNSKGICDGELGVATPDDSLMGSYAASSLPALMLLFDSEKTSK